jgi:hemerythrin superfamily protein
MTQPFRVTAQRKRSRVGDDRQVSRGDHPSKARSSSISRSVSLIQTGRIDHSPQLHRVRASAFPFPRLGTLLPLQFSLSDAPADIHGAQFRYTSTRNIMATATKKTVARPSKPQDAIALLKADHKKVSDLFEQFEKSRSAAKKKKLVDQICLELTVHTQIEEEIFYPAFKAALKDKELVPEANVEHAAVKDLIAQVKGVEPGDEMYDARVKVMSEFVKHHVKEEQSEMFPKAKKSKLDLTELGAQMAARKSELLAAAV